MKTVSYIIILLVVLASCSDSKLEGEIELEYQKLAEERDRQIVINRIKLLETIPCDFDRLASLEVEYFKELNEVRRGELKSLDELDSLLKKKIDLHECWLRNANAENRAKYLKEVASDSIQLKENYKERLLLKMVILEDEIKTFKIYELSVLDSIQSSEHFSVIHEIDINIDDKRVVDTLIYVSFHNKSYNFLTKNLFLVH